MADNVIKEISFRMNLVSQPFMNGLQNTNQQVLASANATSQQYAQAWNEGIQQIDSSQFGDSLNNSFQQIDPQYLVESVINLANAENISNIELAESALKLGAYSSKIQNVSESYDSLKYRSTAAFESIKQINEQGFNYENVTAVTSNITELGKELGETAIIAGTAISQMGGLAVAFSQVIAPLAVMGTSLFAVIKLWREYGEAVSSVSALNNKAADVLKEINEEAEAQKSVGKSIENLYDLKQNELDEFKSSLVSRISKLEEIKTEMELKSENVVFGVKDIDTEKYKQVTAEFNKLKDELSRSNIRIDLFQFNLQQLEEMKTKTISKIQEIEAAKKEMEDSGTNIVDVEKYQQFNQELTELNNKILQVNGQLSFLRSQATAPAEVPLKDSLQEIATFFKDNQAFNDKRINIDISQAQQKIIEFGSTLDRENSKNEQSILNMQQGLVNKIKLLETTRLSQYLDMAERTATLSAENVRKEIEDEEKLNQALKVITIDMVKTKTVAAQNAYDATQKLLDQELGKYEQYAQKVIELDKSILNEKERQHSQVRNLENQAADLENNSKNLSDYDKYKVIAERRRVIIEQLAQYEAQANEKMKAGEFQSAEEIARKREALANSSIEIFKKYEGYRGDQNNYGAGYDSGLEFKGVKTALDQTKGAHDQITKAMEAQKAAAQDNANSQKKTVEDLKGSLDTLSQTLDELKNKELELSLNVNASKVEEELDNIKTKVEERTLVMKIDFDIANGKIDEANPVKLDAQKLIADPKLIKFDSTLNLIDQAREKIKSLEKDTEEAEKEAEKAAEKLKSDAEKKVEVNVDPSEAEKQIENIEINGEKKIEVVTNTEEVKQEINEISKDTESTHTIKVKKVDADSGADVSEESEEQAFAGGGLVRGKGTGTSDEIPAWLSNNEFVMTDRAVKHYGTSFLYEVLNLTYPKIPKFASGGLVTAKMLNNALPSQTHIFQQFMESQTLQPLNLTINDRALPSVRAHPLDLNELVRELSKAR